MRLLKFFHKDLQFSIEYVKLYLRDVQNNVIILYNEK